MPSKSGRGSRAIAPSTVARPELMHEGSDDLFRHFIHDFLAFSERVHSVRNKFAELIELSGVQYTTLVSIAHLEPTQNVSVKVVAEHLHLSGAFLTTVTNQLEAKGLIRKTRDKSDKRRLSLSTTAQCRRALETLSPVQQQVNDELFAGLTTREFRTLAEIISRLVDNGDRAVALLTYLQQTQAVR